MRWVEGVDGLVDALGTMVPEGPFLYPPDTLTDAGALHRRGARKRAAVQAA